MKTIVTALALTVFAAPAFAGTADAIAHFNGDKTGAEKVVIVNPIASSRSTSLDSVFARFNADADSQDGVTGTNGATLVAGTPAVATDIFARIRAESRDSE